jgi:hypothetical protein
MSCDRDGATDDMSWLKTTPSFKDLRPGDWVTFLRPAGRSVRGQDWARATGKVVFAFRDHVTLNCGGRYGTPAVVTEENFLFKGKKQPKNFVQNNANDPRTN